MIAKVGCDKSWQWYQPAPSGSLNGRRLLREELLEGIKAAKLLFDGHDQRPVRPSNCLARRTQVTPEDRVIDVATAIKPDGLQTRRHAANIAIQLCPLILGDGLVEVGNVGGMMLLMVQLHYL